MTESAKYAAPASDRPGRATLTLDSPHNRNALSRQLVTELLAGLDRAEADAEVKVVVIRAEGRTFCSGADLSEAAGEGMDGRPVSSSTSRGASSPSRSPS